MRHLTHLSTAALLLAGTITAGIAHGQERGSVEGWFDLNTFLPTSTPEDGLTVERAAVLENLQPALEVQFQADAAPLTWQRKEDGEWVERGAEVERLLVLHARGAIGLFGYTQLGLQAPLYFERGRHGGASAGMGDMRLVPKGAYRFELGEVPAGLALLVPLTFPTGETVSFTGVGGVTVGPRLAADVELGALRLGLNAGYTWRPSREDYDLPAGPSIDLGIGGAYGIPVGDGLLSILAEVGGFTRTADAFGRSTSPMVLHAGVRHVFGSGISLHGAIGAGLTPGAGAPDVRLLVGAGLVLPSLMPPPREERADEGAEEERAPDRDRDGVADENDPCPDQPEDFDDWEDEDGCPEDDNDGDGIPDGRDGCPLLPENINQLADDDGCPDADTDGDWLINREDQCPGEAEDPDGFEDEDGCPEDDNDLDGILDEEDHCPDLPESHNGNRDEDGCPDYFTLEEDRIVFKRRIRFEKDSPELQQLSFDYLEELSQAILYNPGWKQVLIEVHHSGRGNADKVRDLTQERAEAIKRFLEATGVVPDRLIVTGKGNDAPIAPVNTPEGRAANNRVEVRILKEEAVR